MKTMIDTWKKGGEVKPGPQSLGRKNSEGPQGRTTLKDISREYIKRDFEKAVKDWEAEKAKKSQPKK